MYKPWRSFNISPKAWIPGALLSVLLLGSCHTTKKAALKDEDGFIPIFDGRTLNNWVGDSTYWRVEDGCLVGIVTPQTLLKRNTFIIWQGIMPENFEIRVDYKVSAEGNSGINYRSEKIPGLPNTLRGYQADLNGANTYTGSNYEERRRTTLASQGEKTILPPIQISPDSLQTQIKNNQWLPKVVTGSLGDPAILKAAIRNDDWNQYRIVVRGNHLQHYVNGILMSDVTDNDTINRKFTGFLGVQVHVGPPMRIAYRNFRLKELPPVSFAREIPKFTNTIFVKGVSWQQVKDSLLHQGYSIAEQNEQKGTITTNPREADKNDIREIVYTISVNNSMAKITGKYINNYGSRAVGDVEYWKSTVSAMHFVFLFMDDFAKSLPGEISYAKL